MTQPKVSNTSGSVTPIPQGSTPGAGQDNPGPSDGGGVPDTTSKSKPIPDVTPTAAISVSPNLPAKADTVDVKGSGSTEPRQ